MKKISIETKLEILKISKEMGIDKTSELYNIGRATIFRWKKKIEQEGVLALSTKPAKTISHPSKMPLIIEKSILDLKKNSPNITIEEIQKKLNITYSKSTIQNKIKLAGLTKVSKNKRNKSVKDTTKIDKEKIPFSTFYIFIKDVTIELQNSIFKNDINIPKFEFIIKDKATGLYFSSYSFEKTSLHFLIFLNNIFNILKKQKLLPKDIELNTNSENFFIKNNPHIEQFVQKFNCNIIENKYYKANNFKIDADSEKHLGPINTELKQSIIDSELDRFMIQKNIIKISSNLDIYMKDLLPIYRNSQKLKDITITRSSIKKIENIIYNTKPELINGVLSNIYDINDYLKSFDFDNADINNKMVQYINEIINVYISKAKFTDVIIILNRLLPSLKYAESIEVKAKVYSNLAKAFFRTQDLKKAMKSISISIKLCVESNNQYELADSYRLKGSIYYRQGDIKNALKFYNKNILITKKEQFDAKLCEAYLTVAELYLAIKEIDLAIKILKDAIKISSKFEEKTLKVSALISLGTVYLRSGDSKKSYYYLNKSYKLAVIHCAKNIQLRAQVNLAAISQVLNKFRYSEKIYKALLNDEAYSKNLIWKISIHSNLSSLYTINGKKDLALIGFLKALSIAEEIGDKTHILRQLSALGLYHYRTGSYEKGIKYFNKIILFSKDSKFLFDLVYASYYKAKILNYCNKYVDSNILCSDVLKNKTLTNDKTTKGIIEDFNILQSKNILNLSIIEFVEDNNIQSVVLTNIQKYLKFIANLEKKNNLSALSLENIAMNYYNLWKDIKSVPDLVHTLSNKKKNLDYIRAKSLFFFNQIPNISYYKIYSKMIRELNNHT